MSVVVDFKELHKATAAAAVDTLALATRYMREAGALLEQAKLEMLRLRRENDALIAFVRDAAPALANEADNRGAGGVDAPYYKDMRALADRAGALLREHGQ